MSVRVFAPAKINLTLKVGGARADGLHPLESAVVFADVGDWVEAAPADALSLSVSGPFAGQLGAGEDNLVLRAARLMDGGAGRGAALHLEKHLPVASGIGGGSSDAAATLSALNQLWQLRLSERELHDRARHLGADVPVCVLARSSWITGAGENVAAMQTPLLHAVLVNPQRPLATAEVFRAFDAMHASADLTQVSTPSWRTFGEAVDAVSRLGNDLTAPASMLMPEIADIKRALKDDARVRFVNLSGSGATCFGLVETRGAAQALARELAAQRPGWWIRATTLNATP